MSKFENKTMQNNNTKSKNKTQFAQNLTTFYTQLTKSKQQKQKVHKYAEIAFYMLIALFFVIFVFSKTQLYKTSPIQAFLNNINTATQQEINIKAQNSPDDVLLIQNVLNQINKVRKNAQIPPVQISSSLQGSSLLKSYYIFNLQIFAHDLPNFPWQASFDAFGLANYPKGEVLAVGINDPNQLVLHWLSSQTHKNVLLNKSFNAVGISVVHGQIGGQNTTVIVGHFAQLPQSYLDNTVFPFPKTQIYTNAYTKFINFSNNQGRVVVLPQIQIKDSKIEQTFSTLNNIVAKDMQIPYINFNLKSFNFVMQEQIAEQNRIQLNNVNIRPANYLQNLNTQNPNTKNINNTNTPTNTNILEMQINIPKKNLSALSLSTQISQNTSTVSNFISLQIVIAILALAISAIYAHTAPENKKKYILVEIFWALVVFSATLTI